MKNNLIDSDADEENLKAILEIREQHKNCWTAILKRKFPYLLSWINSKVPLLNNQKFNYLTKLYWIVNGLEDFQLCPICHKTRLERNVDSFEKGYFRACSSDCAAANPTRQQKTRKTMMEKYGSSNFFTSDAGKKKIQDWCKKNGVSNAFQLQSVKDKAAATRKENFGCEYTMQSLEKRKIASDNYKKKTGYDHQFKNPEVIQKVAESKKRRIDKGEDLYAKARQSNRARRFNVLLSNQKVKPLFSLEEFLQLDASTQYTTLLKWHCNECNSDFEAYIDPNFSSRDHIPARCLKCHPMTTTCGTSRLEIELQDFIERIGLDVLCNTKKVISPFELDAYVDSKKVAFELDGLFWHSDDRIGNLDSEYHLTKTNLCEKLGIQLVHVFEDEWLEKRTIAESRIKNLLGIYDKVVFARKCEVREVDSAASKKFQEENHIQGAINSKLSLGLYLDDQLISLMTFGKPRFSKKYEWELLRFCNKLGYHIPGAAGKILKYFERIYKPRSLISYADRRWSQGKLYKALGFQLDHISKPDYWYTKNQKRYSRVKFQKYKLRNLLQTFDEAKTEVENMHNNGYLRIFDCGNYVFVKSYSQDGII